MRKIVTLLLVSLLCVANLFSPIRAQETERPLTRPRDAAPAKDLSRIFKNYERVRLDTAEAARQVRLTGRLAINTEQQSLELELEPHDLRAANYRAEETVDGGIRVPITSGPVRTFKGRVRGNDNAQARFTIDEDSFEGSILTPEERYYVEPTRHYMPSAGPSEFLFYKASDVIETGEPATCGISLHERVSEAADQLSEEKSVSSAAQSSGGSTTNALAVPLEAEIATEADLEYVTALGSAANANNEIMSIINQVEGVYQAEIGLSFKVVFQHAWSTATGEPYTSTDPATAINQFTDYWNATFPNVARDLAHMWTGKNLTNTSGLAWTGVVCKFPANAYGISERITVSPQKYVLTAHEIGHNFGASHTDGVSGCANTIMQAVSTNNSVISFCPTSQNQITSFINANSSCLSRAQVCTYSISPPSVSFSSAGGSDRITVTATAGCTWGAVSNAAWISITAGSSGTGNGAVSYTIAANTAATSRTGTISVAGRTFTVTQGAAAAATPTLTSVTLSAATVTGCKGLTGTVKISAPAPLNGLVVTLTDTLTSAAVPTSVTIAAGGTSKLFSITTTPVSADQTGTVTARVGTVTKSAPLTVRRIGVFSLTATPNPIVGGNSATGRVTLECVAGPGNITVTLSDNLPATTLPASIVIPAGTSSKPFAITTVAVAAKQNGTMTATANGIAKSLAVSVRPIGVLTLALSPNPVTGGANVTGTVTLERPAGPGNIVVTLTSSKSLVASPTVTSITIPAGARSTTFTLRTTPVVVNTSAVITATANGVGKSVTLTVRPI